MYPNVFLFESTIPGVFLIFSPLQNTLFATNKSGAQAFQRIKEDANIPSDEVMLNLLSTNESALIELPRDEFDTADLTICPTFRCQLRCQYCFSRGGERIKSIDISTAKKAVDFAIKRSRVQQQSTSKLTWHGGGEPTLAWTLLKEVSAYHQMEAVSAGMEPILSIVSNGVWSETVTAWIVQHMNKVSISCDGPADIQDIQRPLAGKYPSSNLVFKTLKRLKIEGVDFGIRSTITTFNVKRMEEMVEFFHDLCGPKSLQFEPISVCGRGGDTNQVPVTAEDFAHHFISAHKRAAALGINLGCAGIRIGKRSGRYCGAPGRTICVTPEGLLTTCHRVDSASDALSNEFIYGKVSPEGTNYDRPHIDKLNNRLRVDNLEWCQNCFCKYSCGGGCAASRFADTGSLIGQYSEGRCLMVREITRYRLTEVARKRGLIESVTKGGE
jgi:uncharacterized protein